MYLNVIISFCQELLTRIPTSNEHIYFQRKGYDPLLGNQGTFHL